MGTLAGHLLGWKLTTVRHTKIRAYEKACRNPRAVQWRFLKRLLRRHKDTEFGQKYDFASIKSIEEYQQRVPIHQWKDMEPYMLAVRDGAKETLFPPNEKILMYAATSGTTAEPKFIPITQTSYKLYGRYWDHFWAGIFSIIPSGAHGKALYFPGDPEEGRIGDIPYGAITSKAYAQQSFLARRLYPYPYQIAKIHDYDIRYYTIMRLALETDIRLIPIANPSTIITLFKMAQERAGDMIDDIRTGRLRYADQMPTEVKKFLEKQVKPNAKRANELQAILDQTGDFLPVDYWPNGPIAIACFASGPMKLYLRQLPHYLKDNYRVTDFGLLASEGRLSFAMNDFFDGKGAYPTVESNFFEFIPEDQIDNDNPKILTLDQLEQGQRYFIIFSNFSGLYRYHISDVIEVTGFCEATPRFNFCNKGKHMSSITGEKISEYQVTESVRMAAERSGYRLMDFVMCLHWDNIQPCYTLLKASIKDDSHMLLQQFINYVDEELMKINVEYRNKRESKRLGPLTLKEIIGNEYEKYQQQKQRDAHNISQYKHTFLVGDPDFEHQFSVGTQLVSAANPASL